MKNYIGLVLISLLLTLPGFSQVPQAFSYQAVIRDASGSLVQDKAISIQIRIRQGTIDGTIVYEERHAALTNLNGLMTIKIGDGNNPSEDFSAIDWSNSPYFIETGVDLDGGTNFSIVGASELLSVPYALFSKNSENAVNAENAKVSDRAILADSVLNLPEGYAEVLQQQLELRGDTLFLSDSNYVVIPGIGDLSNVPFSFTFGGSITDFGNAIVQSGDGGFVLVGYTRSDDGDISDGNYGSRDIWVIKIDSEGKKVWDKTFGGSSYDYRASVSPTSDGNFIIVGETSSDDGDISDGNQGNSDIWVIKIDSDGNKIWDKTFGGINFDFYGNVIAQSGDGGFVLVGLTRSDDGDISDGNNGGIDVWVIKIDAEGNKVWDKTFGGSNNDFGNAIVQSSDGGFIVVGNTWSDDGDISDGRRNGLHDVWVIKIDSDGNKIWDKTFGGWSYDSGHAIVQSSDGRFVLVGYTWSDDGDISDGNNGGYDVWVIEIDSEGNKRWDKTFGGSGDDFGNAIVQSSDGGFIVVGNTWSDDGDISDGNNGDSDFWVIKIDAEGNKVWDKTFGGSENDSGTAIVQSSDGDFILVGLTWSEDGDISDGNNGDSDVWIFKINSEGKIVLTNP